MKVVFCLAWVSSSKFSQKDFGREPVFSLMGDYVQRISRFAPCEVSSFSADMTKKPAQRRWLCHTSADSKQLSSEELAKSVQNFQSSGVRELCIAVGGPNGFAAQDIDRWEPDLLWSFGPMTLPHELAAVIAAEQVYRAYSILGRLPYHHKH